MKTKNLKNRIKRGMSIDDNTYAILKRLASDDKVSINDILETLVLAESNNRILNGSKVETFINADIVEETVEDVVEVEIDAPEYPEQGLPEGYTPALDRYIEDLNDEDGYETETYYDDECNDAGYVEENEVRERTLIDELYEEVYSEETIDWLYNDVFANGEVLKHNSGTYYVFENVEYEDGTTSRETYLLNGETLKGFALENVEEELTLALNDESTLDDIDWDYIARTFIEGLEG